MACVLERPQCGNPSFTASLLDAIYKTLDSPVAPEPKPTGTTTGTDHARSNIPKPNHNQPEQKKKPQSDLWQSTNKKQVQFCNTASCDAPPSYGPKLAEINTTHGNPPPILPPKAPPHEKKKKGNSNIFRNRWKDTKKVHNDSDTPTSKSSKSTPSPFGNLIKAIFSTKSTKKKRKQNTTSIEVQPILEKVSVPMPVPEPVLMHRVVRFRESLQSRDLDVNRDMDTDSQAVKMQVDDILKGLECEKGDEIEEGSEQSSDLFELENLADIGSDEVPLFGSTGVAANQTPVSYT